jgi:hypothetical protein
MVRLLRWATILVFIFVVAGVIVSYPILRDRFFPSMLAAPEPSVEVLASVDATAQPTDTALPTPRPTLATATAPALIIEPPSPTATTQAVDKATATAQSDETPTPIAIATTSLLPSGSVAAITPRVLGPTVADQPTEISEESSGDQVTTTSTPTATSTIMTSAITAGAGVALPDTPSTSTPTLEPGTPPEVGEKGYEAPPATLVAGAAVTASLRATGSAATAQVTPVIVTPVEVSTVAITGAITAAVDGAVVTPIVVTTLQLTPQPDIPTPLPLGPTANTDSPLYSGPDFNAAIVGQVTVGDQLTIIGLYTEGTWYLLATGQWIPGAAVNNVPLTLPLVFPTQTPVPSSTPTVTPTPLPTATLVGSPTVTPTPTSLDQPVCDC